MLFTVLAKLSVNCVSSMLVIAGPTQPIMAVLEFPLSALDNNSVNLEFLNLDMAFACVVILGIPVTVCLREKEEASPSSSRFLLPLAKTLPLLPNNASPAADFLNEILSGSLASLRYCEDGLWGDIDGDDVSPKL
mmetsp:Transcript_31275/g.83211  ORF Transcript_31275/g.83211 Transcript_31275/m.83211 type:complete len:135 (-) Transcript_31275:433-837(-)